MPIEAKLDAATPADFAALLQRVYPGENELADLLNVPDDYLETEIGYIAIDVMRIIRNRRAETWPVSPPQPDRRRMVSGRLGRAVR